MASNVITRAKLSLGGDGGKQVTSTSSPGHTIHTADASALDLVWLYATSTHTSAVTLTVAIGTIPGTHETMEIKIQPYEGAVCVAAGWPTTNSVKVYAWADVASVVNLFGHYNRVT